MSTSFDRITVAPLTPFLRSPIQITWCRIHPIGVLATAKEWLTGSIRKSAPAGI